jgi:hypothetical protein
MNNIYDYTTLTLLSFLICMRESVTAKHHIKLHVLFSCNNDIELPNPSFYYFSNRMLMWSHKNKEFWAEFTKDTFILRTRKLLFPYLLLFYFILWRTYYLTKN